ncbi:magnesium transporter, partial [Candidatus Bathyarchaeota archaeon]|nr:magnesium transporter [Candidatus Bathyarchaeota archaeon]
RLFFETVPGQTLIGLSFNIISLFAGGLMAVFTPQFSMSPWILALFPPILTIRGGIGGIFSGNLSTMLHLGLVKPQLRENTDAYWGLVKSVLVITVIDTLILGSFSFVINLINGSALIDQWFLFICVPTVACMLAVLTSIPLTSFIAIETFNRGLDPDIIVYPILASVNDIVVTCFFVGVIFFVLWGGAYYSVLVLFFFLILASMGYLVSLMLSEKFFQQALREGTFVVIISSLFGSINGVLLTNLGPSLKAKPGLMILYPALTNSLGNVGSIIGSSMTTNIALGYARSFLEELRESGRFIVQVELPAALIHVVFGVVSYLLSASQGASLFYLISVALTCNLLSFLVISVFALWSAHISFEHGLNPDNIVIPAITSLSDTTATLAITPAILIAKLLGL